MSSRACDRTLSCEPPEFSVLVGASVGVVDETSLTRELGIDPVVVQLSSTTGEYGASEPPGWGKEGDDGARATPARASIRTTSAGVSPWRGVGRSAAGSLSK